MLECRELKWKSMCHPIPNVWHVSTASIECELHVASFTDCYTSWHTGTILRLLFRWVYLSAFSCSVSPHLNSEFELQFLAFRISMWTKTWNTSKFVNPFSSPNLKADFWNLCPDFCFQLFLHPLYPQNPESIPIPFLNHVQSMYTVMACISGHMISHASDDYWKSDYKHTHFS